jgi:hypothetical protein
MTEGDALTGWPALPVAVLLVFDLLKRLEFLSDHIHIFILSGWNIALNPRELRIGIPANDEEPDVPLNLGKRPRWSFSMRHDAFHAVPLAIGVPAHRPDLLEYLGVGTSVPVAIGFRPGFFVTGESAKNLIHGIANIYYTGVIRPRGSFRPESSAEQVYT